MKKTAKTVLSISVCLGMLVLAPTANAQETLATTSVDAPLYFHAYKPALNGSFQLQPTQGFSIIEPFSGFARMVQVCVRDAKSLGVMPVPTPMLATRTKRGSSDVVGSISVGSCAILEGESIAVGLADGVVDTDTSDDNSRKVLAYMSGAYTILGYYSTTKPVSPESGSD